MIALLVALTFGAPQCDPEDSKSCVQNLNAGESADFSGILLSPRRAAKAAAKLQQCEARVQVEKEEAAAILEIEKTNTEKRLEILEKTHKAQLDVMYTRMADIEKLSGRSWYEHPIVVAIITATASVAVFYGAIEVVKATDRRKP